MRRKGTKEGKEEEGLVGGLNLFGLERKGNQLQGIQLDGIPIQRVHQPRHQTAARNVASVQDGCS